MCLVDTEHILVSIWPFFILARVQDESHETTRQRFCVLEEAIFHRAGGESSEQSRWNLSDLWLACEISSTAQNVIIDLSMILWFHGFSDTSVNPQVTKHLQMECPGWDRAITARIKQETKCVKNKICFENFPYSSKSEDKEKSVFSVQCWSDRIPYENTCLLDQFFLFFFFFGNLMINISLQASVHICYEAEWELLLPLM